MDDLDRAEQEIEMELAEALRIRKPTGPAATGFCLYCREPLPPGQRWCIATGCMTEWEAEERQRRQRVRVW